MADKQHDNIEVWDPCIRLFHWSMVMAMATAWWSQGNDLTLHIQAGTLLAGLLLFRLIWGLCGERHALFVSFLPGMQSLKAHLRGLLSGRPEYYPAHTPLGSLMIYTLLLSMLILVGSGMALAGLQTGTGLFSDWSHAAFSTELWLQTIHHSCYTVLLVLVPVHLGGVLLESLLQRSNLLAAMITGYKKVPEEININTK